MVTYVVCFSFIFFFLFQLYDVSLFWGKNTVLGEKETKKKF